MRITRGNFPALPRTFSAKLQSLVKLMLNTSTYKRPSIYQILKQEIIQDRIQSFLSQTVMKDEFSHTIFHKQQIISKDGKINKLEAPSGGKSKLSIENKRDDREVKPIKTFDPQIEKAKVPSTYNQRPASSNNGALNNYHYKQQKGGNYQVGFKKPSFDIPKQRPKYNPPTPSEEERKRREQKEREREEIRRQVEERERKNKEAQKQLEKKRLEQWRKDYEEKQKRDFIEKQKKEAERRREMERIRQHHAEVQEKRKKEEKVQRSNLYYQAKYEAEMNKRRHQEQERNAANNIFGYDEPEPPKKTRPSTAAQRNNNPSGDLSNNKLNYHYENKAYNRKPIQNGKPFTI